MTHTNEAVRVLREALKGVIRVADRATDEFDAARAALAATATVAKDGGHEDRLKTIRESGRYALIELVRDGSISISAAVKLIEREALATPKPEASAEQQAGECHCEACEPNEPFRSRMILCATCGNKRCPHATDHRNACTNSNEPGQPGSSYANCAAPISEDTGKGEVQCQFDGYGCGEKGPHCAKCTSCWAAPAAQVSDGDALPPLPETTERAAFEAWARPLWGASDFEPTIGEPHLYNSYELRRAWMAWKARAARTVTGSEGSIGEDAEFMRLLDAWLAELMPKDGLDKIIAYIDSRAARNARVAAPDTSARDAALEEAAKIARNGPLIESCGEYPYMGDDCKAMALTVANRIRSLKLAAPVGAMTDEKGGA